MTKFLSNPACPLCHKANPEPMPLRGLGRVLLRFAGVILVLVALAATAVARGQDSDVSTGRVLVAVAIIGAIALGVALAGRE